MGNEFNIFIHYNNIHMVRENILYGDGYDVDDRKNNPRCGGYMMK